MADVNRVRARGRDRGGSDRDDRGRGDGRDRAQLFLLGALALATLFIGLAALLNGVIYAGTLATDDSGADAGDALAYRDATDGVVRSVNADYHADDAAVRADLEATAADWSAAAGRHAAARGVAADATLVDYRRGTRIVQDDAERRFTAADGDANWTLVTDAPGVRSYALTVDRASLDRSDGAPFTVTVANATATWRVSASQTADGVAVGVDRADAAAPDPGECEAAVAESTAVTVDLTAATLGGRQCAPLAAVGWGDGSTVAYHNATNARGTYSFVVEGAVADQVPNGSGYADGPDGSPRYAPAVYAARLRLTYRSPSLTYATSVRVAPGEPNA